MSQVLVYASPEDEAGLALGEAARLAEAREGSLYVLRVLEPRRWLGSLPGSLRVERARALLERNQGDALEAAVEPLREAGLSLTVELRWGTPWLEVVRAVLQDGYDLVVKAAEGAVRGTGLFLGPTALHLIRKCPCPVWIVSSPSAGRAPKLLAALDPEVDDPTRFALAQRIVGRAAELAQALGGELSAVAVWQAPAERLLEPRLDPGELDAWLLALQAEARLGLDRIVAAAHPILPGERARLVKGDPRRVIPELVEAEAYDVLVMGSLGRVGVAGLLLGDTAEMLVRSVRCSVLALKPPSFVCPVRLDDA